MKTYINPATETWDELITRNIPNDPEVDRAVTAIIEQVKTDGDKALREMAAKFDHTDITDLRITDEEIAAGITHVTPRVKNAILNAKANIETFHRAQLPPTIEVETAPGVKCIQKPVAIAL